MNTYIVLVVINGNEVRLGLVRAESLIEARYHANKAYKMLHGRNELHIEVYEDITYAQGAYEELSITFIKRM